MNLRLTLSGTIVIVCEIIFLILEQPMRQHGYGILDQQFAWSREQAEIIFQAWEPIRNIVLYFMLVDLIFPISFFFLNYELHSRAEKNFGRWKKIAFAGMVFDYLENILTFVMLYGTITQIIANFLTIFAVLKFTALIPSFLFGIYRSLRKNAPAGI